VASAVATTSFDRVSALKEELRLHHVEGKKAEAAQLAQKLAGSAANEPFIQGPLQEELSALDATVTNISLDKAVNFSTGRKTEIYCEGQGLVEMSGEHNDGSTSHIVLVRSNRTMIAGSYSQIESGDWTYDFSDSYRSPSLSEFVVVSGTPTSYNLKEIRNKPNGKADSGEFTANWTKNRMSSLSHSSGEVSEPISMYMALDFQEWGNRDLGYKIKFEPGSKDSQETSEHTINKEIVLNSERTVGDFISSLEVKDSSGQTHEYKSCYPVKYQITLKKIEDQQLVVDGKVNKESIKRTLKKNRKQLRKCTDPLLETDDTLKGSVTVSWGINDKGRVTDARPVARNLRGNNDDADFENREQMIECITEKIKTWRFPAAPKGQEVHVTSPFIVRE